MAFIWNDGATKFVDLDEDWDKTEFVLARKLFVQKNYSDYGVDDRDAMTDFTEATIHDRFDKYGPIEKLEIYEEKRNPNRKYAYIQYYCGSDAYIAFLDKQKTNRSNFYPAIIVLPADTWHQPEPLYPNKPNQHAHQDQNNINKFGMDCLNEICLIAIFQYCDILSLVNLCETSRRFNRTIRKKIFPKREKLTLDFHNYNDPDVKGNMTLGKMRRLLCSYGQYVKEVEINFDGNFVYEEPLTIRIMQIFSKYAGTNIEALTIKDLHYKDQHVDALKPVLRRLVTFKILITSEISMYRMDPITSFALDLLRLKVFYIEANRLYDDDVIEFIHHATNLEELDITKTEITLNAELMNGIINARKELSNTDGLGPLVLRVQPWDNTDEELIKMLKDPEIQKLVRLFDSSDI